MHQIGGLRKAAPYPPGSVGRRGRASVRQAKRIQQRIERRAGLQAAHRQIARHLQPHRHAQFAAKIAAAKPGDLVSDQDGALRRPQ